jgi:hypothetical protein
MRYRAENLQDFEPRAEAVRDLCGDVDGALRCIASIPTYDHV